jgi:hypothetical protein
MRIVESWWWALVTAASEIGIIKWLNSELARLRVPLEIKKKQGGNIGKPSMDGNTAATMLACGQQLIYAMGREWIKILSRKQRYNSAAADVENWMKNNIAILKELQWVDKAMHVVSYADLTAEQIRDFPCHCSRLGKCWRDTFGAGVQTFPYPSCLYGSSVFLFLPLCTFLCLSLLVLPCVPLPCLLALPPSFPLSFLPPGPHFLAHSLTHSLSIFLHLPLYFPWLLPPVLLSSSSFPLSLSLSPSSSPPPF